MLSWFLSCDSLRVSLLSGCEFFQEYSSNSYNGHGLIYAWNQAFVDARLVIPSDCTNFHLEIDWNSYKVTAAYDCPSIRCKYYCYNTDI